MAGSAYAQDDGKGHAAGDGAGAAGRREPRPGGPGGSEGAGQVGSDADRTGVQPGGQTSNRPPSNVHGDAEESVKVVASGFDTLHLALEVVWSDSSFFAALTELKKRAASDGAAEPLILPIGDGEDSVLVTVEPAGVRSYEWRLTGADLCLKIGNWLEPADRPSVMAEVRSEALWRIGAEAAAKLCCSVLRGQGAAIRWVKPSRVDLCADVLMPESLWDAGLLKCAVMRASRSDTYRQHNILTGFTFGKGAVSARVYDKPAEIRARSQKEWMFGVWGLEGVPSGCRIIRVEFQVRRDALREMALNDMDALLAGHGRLWSYCTERWLRFADGPGEHVSRRETLSWWRAVQVGYRGAQPGEPLVRAAAVRGDRERLLAQAGGVLTSLVALDAASQGALDVTAEYVPGAVQRVALQVAEAMVDGAGCAETVRRKLARYRRAAGGRVGGVDRGEKVIEPGPEDPCPF